MFENFENPLSLYENSAKNIFFEKSKNALSLSQKRPKKLKILKILKKSKIRKNRYFVFFEILDFFGK